MDDRSAGLGIADRNLSLGYLTLKGQGQVKDGFVATTLLELLEVISSTSNSHGCPG
jgi:hypothetical protein